MCIVHTYLRPEIICIVHTYLTPGAICIINTFSDNGLCPFETDCVRNRLCPYWLCSEWTLSQCVQNGLFPFRTDWVRSSPFRTDTVRFEQTWTDCVRSRICQFRNGLKRTLCVLNGLCPSTDCGIMLRTFYVQILHIMTTACSTKEEFEILKSQKFSCRDRVLAFLLGHFC